ncbi:MAG: hypothetical protein K2Y39_09565 [Candidatus Obscuribacterales bacterium]|nr:hypothetical protein [Candidatus Obscuribacterales bacterium]
MRFVFRLAVPFLLSITVQQTSIAANFKDSHDDIPAGYSGPAFKLSQNYPETLPSKQEFPWKTVDFKTQPDKYLSTVLAYCFEGNTDCDFYVEKNTKGRKWYGAPWLHVGPSGREFIHGMTSERSARKGELSYQQADSFQNWAVGFYNEFGGYTFGKVWKDPNKPDISQAKFPEGTVAFKLLFTATPLEQAPFLKDSVAWTANIYDLKPGEAPPSPPKDLPRKPQLLRLLQIDVAVKDSNAKETGWVFGTFVYNKDAQGKSPWERMVPVGLMYGNDPTLTKAKIQIGEQLKETIISKNCRPYQHLGWAGRLNGPVDNPNSSCLSCHSTAQWWSKESSIPKDMKPPAEIMPTYTVSLPGQEKPVQVEYDSRYWMDWFRNVPAGVPFNRGLPYLSQDAASLDYSLQLAAGVFAQYAATHPMEADHMDAPPGRFFDFTNFFNREGH